MRILLLGATGKTGLQIIDQAVLRGFHVTALVRSPEKLAGRERSIEVLRGDVCDEHLLGRALVGHDAVVSALGHRGLGRSSLLTDSAGALIPAMRAAGVERALFVSVALLFRDAGLFATLIRKTVLRNVVADAAAMEMLVAASGLDWTIVRPPILTNGPKTFRYRAADGAMPERTLPVVSRADLADFLLEEVEHPAHSGRIVGVGSARATWSSPVRAGFARRVWR